MKKILVIDDDELFLELLLVVLRKEGWQVISTDNGQSGLQLAKEQMPSLIICDIRMIGFSGYQVLKVLREDSLTQKIPVILLTATLTDKERIYAQKLGANDCLSKFCKFEELLKLIETRIELLNIYPHSASSQINDKKN